MTVSIVDLADWLRDADLQRLLATLNANGDEARIAGGAVRNALLGQAVTDIDIASTTLPDETIRRAESAGFKTAPTGIEHGTITVIAAKETFEVTTLRADIETDGRKAKVRFGRDWKADAERRDFTINGLYAMADGTVIDLVGGLSDLESRTLRFIGDPEARIHEDYLRILRFFRFFAWYGSGRPDAEGLKACARLKDGLDRLSAERVWNELRKLFSAPDPSRTLLWMRQSGVLSRILPETEKWGIDALHPLVRAEQDLDWPADPLLRLAAIVPPDAKRLEAMATRLKFSNADKERLGRWAASPRLKPKLSERDLAKLLYRGSPQAIVDQLRLKLAAARAKAIDSNDAMMEAGGYARLLKLAESWQPTEFPLKGSDLLEMGATAGPALGKMLKSLEDLWIDSGFSLTRGALLERAAEMLKA